MPPPVPNLACPPQPPHLPSALLQPCLQAPMPPWVRAYHTLSIFSTLSSLIRNFNKIAIKISGFYGCSGPLIKLMGTIDAIKLLCDEEQTTGVCHRHSTIYYHLRVFFFLESCRLVILGGRIKIII